MRTYNRYNIYLYRFLRISFSFVLSIYHYQLIKFNTYNIIIIIIMNKSNPNRNFTFFFFLNIFIAIKCNINIVIKQKRI